jgi:hypothetical protein
MEAKKFKIEIWDSQAGNSEVLYHLWHDGR